MNRRDTIIVAVLVNSALLLVLFATAIRSKDPEPLQLVQEAPAATPKPHVARKPAPKSVNRQEELLNEYVSSVPVPIETKREEVAILHQQEAKPILTPASKNALESEKPKVEAEVELVKVTVKQGDFLERIAKNNHTTISTIMKLNNLTSTQLKVGQVLKVPLVDVPEQKSIQLSADDYYVVKDGDNPWLIASRNHIKLEELIRLNDLDEQKAKRLRPGDRLRIR